MRISKKAEYGLRAMIILADAPPNQTMQIQDLAEKGGVPVKFLEQILLSLKKAGLSKSKRGVGGGYQLNRPARSISVADVIVAIDGDLCSLAGDGDDALNFRGAEGLKNCLKSVDQTVNEKLHGENLESILESEVTVDVGFGI